MALAGCGGGDAPGLLAEPNDGRRLANGAGCLACHQIGADANSDPGNNLDGIGTRRSPSQMRRTLVDSPAPMPSYRSLPRRKLDSLVAYPSTLRGDASCAKGSDCG